MRIIKTIGKIFFLSVFFILGSCEPETDPCLSTKWKQSREFEILLSVRLSESNPLFSGGAVGSQKPWDFKKMTVSGTIEKIECNGETAGPVNLGNTYITQEDYPEPIEEPITYWIGHVVYVYEFDNDEDKINISLTIKITMADGQSYKCTFSEEFYSDKIVQMPGEMYYYILSDVYSDSWVKV